MQTMHTTTDRMKNPPTVAIDRWVPCSYYVEIDTDRLWLNQKSRETSVFENRGLWDTHQAAAGALQKYLRKHRA